MTDRPVVLIADGDPPTVPSVEAELEALGYGLIRAPDAFFVLTMARRDEPKAVVLGLRLAAGGPLTALRRLRASVHTAAIPVIALAHPGPEKQELLSLGVDACLEPPVSDKELLECLEAQAGTQGAVTGAPREIIEDPDRLAALDETQLMDADPDEALDILTHLAAHVLGLPVALVSLVDDRRQYFKSLIGLPAPWDESRQTPLSHSFCQWVVSSQEELIVQDAREHPILADNGAVADLGVVAYAGIPLSTRTGQPIGSFCAIDGKPREWSENDLATLRDLAQMVDAYVALGLSREPDEEPPDIAHDLSAIARAASRGFLGAARLLRRTDLPISDRQRSDLIGFIERYSYRLTEIASGTVV